MSPLDHEILGEKAAALGRAGEKVELCLKQLHDCAPDALERPRLLREAAHAVYAYFIQRELCGMKRHREIIREYAIPDEVLVRLGAS
ncbi:MAG: DUF6665 family protein [Rhizobiaceae bacterium]